MTAYEMNAAQRGGSMPRKSTNVPKFKSDTEEADWYATPERQGARSFPRVSTAPPNGIMVCFTATAGALSLVRKPAISGRIGNGEMLHPAFPCKDSSCSPQLPTVCRRKYSPTHGPLH